MKNINLDDFNYQNFLEQKEDDEDITGKDAIKVFSHVLFIITIMIQKFKIKVIKFKGRTPALHKLYTNFNSNKFFNDLMKDLDFEYIIGTEFAYEVKK